MQAFFLPLLIWSWTRSPAAKPSRITQAWSAIRDHAESVART
jgi:hypothetical protein